MEEFGCIIITHSGMPNYVVSYLSKSRLQECIIQSKNMTRAIMIFKIIQRLKHCSYMCKNLAMLCRR